MRHDEIIESTKKNIRHHLCQLILSKNYDDITVKEICDNSKVSRMTFYRFYNNKDDVLIEYTDERFADFFSIVQNIPNIDDERFLLEALKYIDKYKVSINYLIRAHREFLLLEQFNSYAKYLAAKYQNTLDITITEDGIRLLTGGFLNFIMQWIISEPNKTPEEMFKRITSVITKPLFTTK